MDFKRGIIYGYTYPAELLFCYDLHSGQSKVLGYVGNAILFAQPHNSIVDAEGWLWGTYAETRAWDEMEGPWPIRLFKYHPDEDRFVWFDHGLSRKVDPEQLCSGPIFSSEQMPDAKESRHKKDYGFCDSMVYDGRRYIYAGTVAGVLSRIDTRTGEVMKVANVIKSGRLPALGFGPDGKLYGSGGLKGMTALCRLDCATLALEICEEIQDASTGDRPARIHELCVANDGTIYLAENDNHQRSSYLWSVRW
jgi:hypothetical protein